MTKPTFVSERELHDRFHLARLLASGGRYGCGGALFEGDVVDDGMLFYDEWFYALNEQHPNDVGIVVITGDVRAERALSVSDRLMCLVVLGSLDAPSLAVFETEVYIGGDLRVAELIDRDDQVTVKGTRVAR
jgi:hypothetical protein